MRWSLPFGTVLGIKLRLHFTFLLFLAFFGWLGYQQVGWFGVFGYIGLLLVFFGIILLHELGHSIAAMRFGVTVPHITLTPIGGVASLSSIPEDPRQEFIIAIAGPAVNAILAVPLAAMSGWWWPTPLEIFGRSETPPDIWHLIHMTNLGLLYFNLVPAFPMDGGRILRAGLAAVLSYDRATMIAATLGRIIACFFMFSGPVWRHFGWNWSPMLTLIGLFVFFGAGRENRWVRLRKKLQGRTAGEILQPVRVVLGPHNRLSDILAVIHRTPQLDFPVFDGGNVVGLVSRDRWMDTARLRHDDPPLHQIMDTHFITVRPQAELVRLVYDRKLARQALFPIAENGRILGYATRSDLDLLLHLQSPPPLPPPLPRAVA